MCDYGLAALKTGATVVCWWTTDAHNARPNGPLAFKTCVGEAGSIMAQCSQIVLETRMHATCAISEPAESLRVLIVGMPRCVH